MSTSAALIDNGDTTIDTATGLEWLDLTLTQGRSYDNNPGRAISEWVDELNDDKLRQTYDEMMLAIYARGNSRSSVTCRFINQLTAAVRKQYRPNYTVQWAVEMKLN